KKVIDGDIVASSGHSTNSIYTNSICTSQVIIGALSLPPMKKSPLPVDPQSEPASGSEKVRSWGRDRRLAFIGFRLRWEGRLNRVDLKSFFQISTPQASLDIADYTTLAPENLSYDRSSRVYVAGEQFEPAFPSSCSETYLNQLLAIEAGI